MTPVDLVQAQLDAYNAQDLDGPCACFAGADKLADWNGPVTHDGLAAVRRRYAELFSAHPQNRAELVNRLALGEVVIDEERIMRGKGIAPFAALAIYTVKSGLIARVDFVRS
jgi:hypothetical protein